MPSQYNTYTPFFERGAANLGNAYMQMQGNQRATQEKAQLQELTKAAYMGDQQAMAQLTAINPQVAGQIQQSQRQARQDKISAEGAQVKAQDRQRKLLAENRDLIGSTLQEAAKFETIEEAQSFIDTQIEANKGIVDSSQFQPLTPETFDQIKTQFATAEPSELEQAKIEKTKTETKILEQKFKDVATEDVVDISGVLTGSTEEGIAAGVKAYKAAGGGKDGVNAALKASGSVDKKIFEQEDKDQAIAQLFQSASSFSGMIEDPSFAGAVGFIDQLTAPIGAQFGTKEGVLNKRAQRAASKLVLEAAESLKGSMSDRDIQLLEESAPSAGDNPAVWSDWYTNEFLPKVKIAAKKAGFDMSKIPGGDTKPDLVNELVNKYAKP